MFKRILFTLLALSLGLAQMQFIPPSVAVTDDPLAIRYNPAGLGFHNHTEAMIFAHFDGSQFTKDFAYYEQAGPIGLAYEWDAVNALNIWRISQGMKVSKHHALGFTYSFDNSAWKSGRYDIAWMHRPLPFLSMGANLRNVWSGGNDFRQLLTGIALQNTNGRFGAGFDMSFEFDDSGSETVVNQAQSVSAFVEIIEGLRLNAYVDLNATSNFGVSLSMFLPEFGMESHGYSKSFSTQSVGMRFSTNPYRTMFGEKPVKKDQKTYIRLKFSATLMEEPEVKKPKIPFDFDFSIPFLSSPTVYAKQLRKFIDKIDTYTEDDHIHGMIIDFEYLGGGFSKISEVRDALQRFHDAGKKIIVYSKFGLSNSSTFLLSMADEIYTHEMAGVGLQGLGMEITFYRGLLDTLSIVPEVWRVSPFKTAADPFYRDSMSDAMRENYTQLLNGVYNEFVRGIADGKGWTVEETRAIIDGGPYLLAAEAEEKGLITGTMYPDEFKEYVKDLEDGKIKIRKPKHEGGPPAYNYAWKEGAVKDKVAVIYAVGGIIPGKTKPGPSGSTQMGDETIAKAIKQAREDKDIKAIVLRIDSGGGSALASDIMWREVLKTTETDSSNIKPFIASMSDVAASGGYYIACQADSIIAYPSTVTGSIGVTGMRLNYSQLMERFGIHTDRLKQGEHADFLSGNRLATEEENEAILASINDTYVKFKERVLKGRPGVNEAHLDTIALGKVWTGVDALDYGLIDKVGGYYAAIDLAKEAAGIEGEVEIVEMPYYKKENDLKKLLDGDVSLDLISQEVLESMKINDLIPIIQGGEIQMIMPVKIEIK